MGMGMRTGMVIGNRNDGNRYNGNKEWERGTGNGPFLCISGFGLKSTCIIRRFNCEKALCVISEE